MGEEVSEVNSNSEGNHPGDRDGCKHYRRKAQLVAPCCFKVYTCRLCHDESEDHVMKRHMVEEMVCSYCDARQPVAQSCSSCHTVLGRYYCAECRLHDDQEKKQFHCDSCGICRAGGRSNFFHCGNCDLCLPNNLKDNHKCIKDAGRSDCGICLEDIHSSRSGGRLLPCGHLLHTSCFRDMRQHGISTCPKCKVSVTNREREWARMDLEIRRSHVPTEFRHSYVSALCCDCRKTTETRYHIIGLKCGACGSYNTQPAGPVMSRGSSGLTGLLGNFRRMLTRVA